MTTTRIYVLSDHLMFAHGIKSLLSQEFDYQIVGHETDIEQAIEQIKNLKPDIVIFDNSGSTKSEMALKRILLVQPGTKVIGLSLNNNNLYIYQATQKVVRNIGDFRDAIDHTQPNI